LPRVYRYLIFKHRLVNSLSVQANFKNLCDLLYQVREERE
jgi:hypothetical protein